MSDATRDPVESFLADDLLISLGAMRLALGWARAGADDPGSPQLFHLERELEALGDRAKVVYRALRDGAVPASAPADPPPAKAPAPLPADPPPAEAAAPAPIDLDRVSGRPEPAEAPPPARSDTSGEPRGLAPAWLDDLDEADARAEADRPEAGPPAAQASAPPTIGRLRPQRTSEDLGQSIDQLLASAISGSSEEAKTTG